MQTPTRTHPPQLLPAIAQVRSLLKQTPDAVLAGVYRTVARTTHDSAQDATAKAQWASVLDYQLTASDSDIAESLRSWIERTIETADPRTLRDFLGDVCTGIVAVARRS